jgi:hypothetical protein
MATAFRKGQKVTFIADWDRKGTVTFRHAVVYSCGMKQMVLTDAVTGDEMGRHFKPAVGSLETIKTDNCYRMAGGTFPRMTDEEAVEAGLKVAAAIQQYEREHFARCLAGGHGEGYNMSIRKDIDALHDLRAIPYSDAVMSIHRALA